MTRRLLNLVTVVSLLLCALATAGWVGGARTGELFLRRLINEKNERTGDLAGWSYRGSLVLQLGLHDDPLGGEASLKEPVPGPQHFVRWQAMPGMAPTAPITMRFMPFGYGTYAYTFGPSAGAYVPRVVNNHVVAVPWPLLILLTAAWPLLTLYRSRTTRRRQRHNACPQCGYDLRATPDQCPECGVAPSTQRLAGGLARRPAAQEPA